VRFQLVSGEHLAGYLRREWSRHRSSPVTCPVMGVWSSGDMALSEVQMSGSEQFVTGPWRYERIEGSNHWIPVYASEQLSSLLVDFLTV